MRATAVPCAKPACPGKSMPEYWIHDFTHSYRVGALAFGYSIGKQTELQSAEDVWAQPSTITLPALMQASNPTTQACSVFGRTVAGLVLQMCGKRLHLRLLRT